MEAKDMPNRMQIPQELLYDFEPQESWLAHDSEIHGVGHMARVFILQELICNQLEDEGTAVNRQATRFGAMAHDVGRHDDGRDLEHGRRSAEWMQENLADKMPPETLDVATYIVHWHVPPDDEAPVMTTELKVLKDADGLDRARLGDLDPSYLRTNAAKNLVKVAQQLYEASQRGDGNQGKDTFETVLEAAKQLKLIKP